jgi:hypothetical protein
MGTKVISIDKEGIEEHINRYFELRGSSSTYLDVVRLYRMRIGGRKLSIDQQAKELGVGSRNTLYLWHRHINAL